MNERLIQAVGFRPRRGQAIEWFPVCLLIILAAGVLPACSGYGDSAPTRQSPAAGQQAPGPTPTPAGLPAASATGDTAGADIVSWFELVQEDVDFQLQVPADFAPFELAEDQETSAGGPPTMPIVTVTLVDASTQPFRIINSISFGVWSGEDRLINFFFDWQATLEENGEM